MLTDTFDNRYADVALWDNLSDNIRKLLLQSFRIVSEQLLPFFTTAGSNHEANQNAWKRIEQKLSMELGLENLSPKYVHGFRQTAKDICQAFMVLPPTPPFVPDEYIKVRISFIELAFREKQTMVEAKYNDTNFDLQEKLNRIGVGGMRLPGEFSKSWNVRRDGELSEFQESVDELNTRFSRAGVPLNYHSGFIQLTADNVIRSKIEAPFWAILRDSRWKNVETDILEAIDRRDNASRDSAFYAAKALESTIKIISGLKGVTHGNEKGAHNYIDNIGSKKSNNFIVEWEKESLKNFFSSLRNPFGHGAGDQPMLSLTRAQTEWAIEFVMIWIKSLIQRL